MPKTRENKSVLQQGIGKERLKKKEKNGGFDRKVFLITIILMSSSNPQIAFVYFDVGGVLLTWEQSLQKFANETGKTFQEVKASHTKHGIAAGRGEINYLEYWRRIKTDLGISIHHASDYHTYTIDTYLPIIPTHSLILEVTQKYPTGLLTNMEPDMLRLIRERGLIPDILYTAIVDSSVAGSVKPEEKIFRIAEERSHTPPGYIFFIDDNEANVIAAREHGWHAFQFDTEQSEDSVEEIRKILDL